MAACRRPRECSSDHATRGSGGVAEGSGHDVDGDEAGRCDGGLRQPVLAEAPEKLRATAVTDGKQEQREKALLDVGGDIDSKLTDQHPGKQRTVTALSEKPPKCNLPKR